MQARRLFIVVMPYNSLLGMDVCKKVYLYVCAYIVLFGKVQLTMCSVCVQKMHVSWCGVHLTNACGLQCVHKVKGGNKKYSSYTRLRIWAVTLYMTQDKT